MMRNVATMDPAAVPQRERLRWIESFVVVLVLAVIAVGVLGALSMLLLPNVVGSNLSFAAFADEMNLRRHHEWLQYYARRHGSTLPAEGGYQFVLATWTSGTVEHTRENFERYFTPGPARDNDLEFARLRGLLEAGNDPWPDLALTTSTDTHYVGLAMGRPRAGLGRNDALMANDNEDTWSLRDGRIQVLFADGTVRSFTCAELQRDFGVGPFDRNVPVRTWGPEAPIPACRGLSNAAR